jgi:hypothetical protein
LKPGLISKPTQYLGTTISEFRLDDDPTKIRWALTAENYNTWHESRGRTLKTKTTTVLPSGFFLELDVSELSHLRSFLVLDNSYVDVPLAVKPDWTDFYPDDKEELPPLTFLKCFDFILLMLCQQ